MTLKRLLKRHFQSLTKLFPIVDYLFSSLMCVCVCSIKFKKYQKCISALNENNHKKAQELAPALYLFIPHVVIPSYSFRTLVFCHGVLCLPYSSPLILILTVLLYPVILDKKIGQSCDNRTHSDRTV